MAVTEAIGNRRELKFAFGGQEYRYFTNAPGDLYPAEYRDIVEGLAYPFYEDIQPEVILDIGANVGLYSLMASLVWPNAQVWAYEPEPDNFDCLKSNIQGRRNITACKWAIGPRGGWGTLYTQAGYPLCHSLFQRAGDSPGEPLKVPMFPARNLPKADLIKLDCEGPELQILETMDLSAVKWLYVEFHREEDRMALDHLLLDQFKLRHARIVRHDVGEVMYQRRGI